MYSSMLLDNWHVTYMMRDNETCNHYFVENATSSMQTFADHPGDGVFLVVLTVGNQSV